MQTLPLLCLLTMWLAPNAAHAAPLAQSQPAPESTCSATDSVPDAKGSFTIGTLHVERYGDHGRPLILIPGLGSGAWVWRDSVRHLQHDHVVYALTLAGFDGTPPPARMTGLMDQATDSLLKLIKSHHIDHPVLVGHSIGGTLAIRFAQKHSDLLSGVVAVDGLPVLPWMASLTAAQRKARAKGMRAQMAGATPQQFRAQQIRYMEFMGVRDESLAKRCGRLQARSDAATVAEYYAEDVATDDRPGLKNIHVPLLEISPYDAADFKRAAEKSGRPLITEKAKTAMYRRILSGAPHAEVVSIEDSRHFVMLDQPRKFLHVLDGFLSRLSEVKTP